MVFQQRPLAVLLHVCNLATLIVLEAVIRYVNLAVIDHVTFHVRITARIPQAKIV